MCKRNNKVLTTAKIEIETDEALNKLKIFKEDLKSIIKDWNYQVSKLTLKRKDILLIKMNCILLEKDIKSIEKRIKKKIHRKIIIIDSRMDVSKIEL